jgi:hypothetical protein
VNSLCILAPLRKVESFVFFYERFKRQKLPIAGGSNCQLLSYPAFAKSFSRGA